VDRSTTRSSCGSWAVTHRAPAYSAAAISTPASALAASVKVAAPMTIATKNSRRSAPATVIG